MVAPSTRECGICVYQRDLEAVYREFLGQDPDREWLTQLAVQHRVQTVDPPGHSCTRWLGFARNCARSRVERLEVRPAG